MMASGLNSPKSFATTIGGYGNEQFTARAERIPVPATLDQHPPGKFRLADELKLFLRVVQSAAKKDALLLFSSRGKLKPELLATAVVGLWPKRWRPAIVLYGEMYEQDTGIRGRIERLIMKLADRAVTRYAVHSEAERELFAEAWNVSTSKIRVCRITYRVEQATAPCDKPRGKHIFAGGNAFRDYEPLLEAARKLPELQFIISTTRLGGRTDIPTNVQVGMVDHEQFVSLMETAAAVVVPLKKGLRRAAGMMTYLESMALGTLTIVSDALAVREYIQDGETGLVVDGSADSYVQAIQWALDPANHDRVTQICHQARQTLHTQYTQNSRITQLLNVMDEVTGKGASYLS